MAALGTLSLFTEGMQNITHHLNDLVLPSRPDEVKLAFRVAQLAECRRRHIDWQGGDVAQDSR